MLAFRPEVEGPSDSALRVQASVPATPQAVSETAVVSFSAFHPRPSLLLEFQTIAARVFSEPPGRSSGSQLRVRGASLWLGHCADPATGKGLSRPGASRRPEDLRLAGMHACIRALPSILFSYSLFSSAVESCNNIDICECLSLLGSNYQCHCRCCAFSAGMEVGASSVSDEGPGAAERRVSQKQQGLRFSPETTVASTEPRGRSRALFRDGGDARAVCLFGGLFADPRLGCGRQGQVLRRSLQEGAEERPGRVCCKAESVARFFSDFHQDQDAEPPLESSLRWAALFFGFRKGGCIGESLRGSLFRCVCSVEELLSKCLNSFIIRGEGVVPSLRLEDVRQLGGSLQSPAALWKSVRGSAINA